MLLNKRSLEKRIILTSEEPLAMLAHLAELHKHGREFSGLVELRADLCDSHSLGLAAERVSGLGFKSILTFRGTVPGAGLIALGRKSSLIDVDFSESKSRMVVEKAFPSKLLLSAHVGRSELGVAVRGLSGIARRKLVLLESSNQLHDAEKIFSMQKLRSAAKSYHSLFCTGRIGALTRITSLLLGMHTYCRPDSASGTAAGQLPLSSALQIAQDVSGMQYSSSTKLCFLIGSGISKSLSPAIHNKLFRMTGTDAVYFRLGTELAGIQDAVRSCRLSVVGYANVTTPFKEQALALADSADKHTERIGAANTLLNRKGKLVAHNTDWLGFLTPIEKRLSLVEKAVVIGAGGAARAVAYALVSKGKSVGVVNRTHSKAISLGRQLGCEIADERFFRQSELVVNCTPPVSELQFENLLSLARPSSLFYDLHYLGETAFLKFARSKGFSTINGLPMLLEQAVLSFSAYRRRRFAFNQSQKQRFLHGITSIARSGK